MRFCRIYFPFCKSNYKYSQCLDSKGLFVIFAIVKRNMETTDKASCNIIINLLQQHGVEHVVISPGSRNAPLIVAVARCNNIKKTIIIDERSAAFVALGIASASNQAVALICTSGSALLNYAPAIAEAYYRRIPLIVISADRPIEWIDQDDSQTIRQYEALANYVKRSYNIPAQCLTNTDKWYVNRIVNDALLTAKIGRKSPVHINVQLDEPLNHMIKLSSENIERVVNMVSYGNTLSWDTLNRLSKSINNATKILIIAGFYHPDKRLDSALKKISELPSVAIMSESIANLRGSDDFINCIDRTLSIMTDDEKQLMRPDIVITYGGALISRHIKQYLRKYRPVEHWHVGISDTTIDCFQSLTMRIEVEPVDFFEPIASSVSSLDIYSDYSLRWTEIKKRATQSHDLYLSTTPWSDFKAFSAIMDAVPNEWNLQLSNGTVIRYAQLFADKVFRRSDCNRGVSGIDGCTSTAIGASIVNDDVTLLITGDMSAQYDIGALANDAVSPRFKMIVMCNGGGGIFRFINSTSSLPGLEKYFVVKPKLPLRNLADGYGFAFFEVSDSSEIEEVMPHFISESEKPAILAVNTPAGISAQVLKDYFNRNQK